MTRPVHPIRILIANEKLERLGLLATVVEELGHEVAGRSVVVAEVAAETARVRPDVALVGLGESSAHALELITEIVRESYCPVIAILSEFDSEWVTEAANRGVYAYIVEGPPDELQSAIDVTLSRFAEAKSLQGAVERRTAEAERDKAATDARQRQALELHDGVVQGLVTARLAQDMGHEDKAQVMLDETLDRARAVVTRSLEELKDAGLDTGQVIRDSSTDPATDG